MEPRKPSTVMVNVVGVGPLIQTANAVIKQKEPEAQAEIRYAFGYVKTKKGIFVLCSEGVGSSKPITEKNRFEVQVYSVKDLGGGRKSMPMFPDMVFNLGEKSILSLPIEKQVPLHEFIRVFGSRLECNYAAWERHFQKVKPI